MKNKIFKSGIIIVLFISITGCAQNLKKIPLHLPYSTDSISNLAIKNYYLKENFFPNDNGKNVGFFDKNFSQNMKIPNFYNNHPIIPKRDIGYFKYEGFSYFISAKCVWGDWDELIYEQWIKSFNTDGHVIDSLQLVFYTSTDGSKRRMTSKIVSPEKIEIEHHHLQWDPGVDDPDVQKIKTIKGDFKIKDGRFIFQNDSDNAIFFDGYGYGDIYTEIGSCYTIDKSINLDVDKNNLNDIIYVASSKNNPDKYCSERKEIFIGLADTHGLFQVEIREEIKFLNTDYTLTDISSYSNGLIFMVKKIDEEDATLLLYANYNKKHKNFSLEKAELKTATSTELLNAKKDIHFRLNSEFCDDLLKK